MKNFFKIIRIQNLFIIALTQVAIRYFVIQPILFHNGFNLSIELNHFILFVASTVLIAAGGYIINDFFDVKVDYINKPDEVIVGKKLSKKLSFALYISLSIIGFIIGSYFALLYRMPELIVFYMIIIGLLYFYSYTYSKQLIIGNVIVAVLTAMVPLIIGVAEIKAVLLANATRILNYLHGINEIKYWVMGYSFFAFITTLTREIIKDAEDFEGDSVDNRDTIPITFGIKTTKLIIQALNFILLLSLIIVYILYIDKSFFSLSYILITIFLPVVYSGYIIMKANYSINYKLAGDIYKYVMVAGLMFSVVYGIG